MIHACKIRKAVKKRPSAGRISGKIGLIIDAENYRSQYEPTVFYKKLGVKKEFFKVVVCGRSDENNGVQVEYLLQNEISVSGKFRREGIQEFLKEEVDVLICYFSEMNTGGSLLAATATASLKIGNSPDVFGIYDLEIHTREMDEFQQEALKYIEILKKKN